MDQDNLYNELIETDNSKLRNGFIQLISLPDEPLKIIVNFLSKFIKNKILPTDISSADLKKYDIKLTDYQNLTNIILLIRFSLEPQGKKRFDNMIHKLNFNNNEIKKINEQYKKIIDFLLHFEGKDEIEKFGLPYFKSIELMTDFRIFTNFDNSKEIIPMILCKIIAQGNETDKDSPFIFQFNIGDLDNLIKNLQQFRKNIEIETNFIENKKVT